MGVLSTYLPPWRGQGSARVAGADEDAITMAVAAGRPAIERSTHRPTRVVLVTRELPLLEGGNGAALLGGLGLPSHTEVVEQLGGAPAALDAMSAASPGTLVLGSDTGVAGAGAWLADGAEAPFRSVGRSSRSLPLRVRSLDGVIHDDDDPRLQRERGLLASLSAADLPGTPIAIAGVPRRDAIALCAGDPPALDVVGASSPFFMIAALVESGSAGLVVAAEQAALTAVDLLPAEITVLRTEPPAQEPLVRRTVPGPEIKLVHAAYDRAFESKLRFEAGRCPTCGKLAFPQRHRCLECGEEGTSELVALPRTGSVYTTTTVHVPVPGLASPYSLAVIELDGVGVRALVTITDSGASVDIGQRGRLELRRVATRSGVPDYGYAFSPEAP